MMDEIEFLSSDEVRAIHRRMLDELLLQHFGPSEEAKVKLTVDSGSLIVTPVEPEEIPSEKFQACLDRVIDEWGDVLKRLA